MKKLPIGISNLREIIEGSHAYVDKSRFVFDLTDQGKYYFLSRPRRFGKSLLIDTLKLDHQVFECHLEENGWRSCQQIRLRASSLLGPSQ